MSLSVVYARDTGHVLAALAVTGPAGAAPAVVNLVGERLPVPVTLGLLGPVYLPVPAARLEAVTIQAEPDVESAVLAHPMRYGVAAGASGPRLSPLDTWELDEDPVERAPSGLKVTLREQATRSTPVLVVAVARGGTPVTEVDEIVSGKAEVTLRMSLSGEPHGVLTLVAGWEGRLDTVQSS